MCAPVGCGSNSIMQQKNFLWDCICCYKRKHREPSEKNNSLFYDEGPYHIETNPLIFSANQWACFYMLRTYVRKGSNKVNYQQMKVWYVLYISNSDVVREIYRHDVNIFSGKEWRLSKDVFRTLPNIWDKALS